jgi:hypothetical protein
MIKVYFLISVLTNSLQSKMYDTDKDGTRPLLKVISVCTTEHRKVANSMGANNKRVDNKTVLSKH